MKRLIPILLILSMIFSVFCGTALALDDTDGTLTGEENTNLNDDSGKPALFTAAMDASVSLRIEGPGSNLYCNSALPVSDALTVADVLGAACTADGSPTITLSGGRITDIGGVSNGKFGGADSWNCMVNGVIIESSLNDAAVYAGDEIILYYADLTGGSFQYPSIDTSKMMKHGIVLFTDTFTGAPIAGATVVWDGFEYKTNGDGEIIIDSTGIDVAHTVSISRSASNGLSTVLRFEPDHSVTPGFDDVRASKWYSTQVTYAVNHGLMLGMSGNTFEPDSSVNRAMFVTMLGRMTKTTVDHNAQTRFTDLKYDGWSLGYISWAANYNIVNGMTPTTFEQYNPITREQIATILYRFAKVYGYDTSQSADLSSFPDGDSVSNYAREAMEWAVGSGIIKGMDGMLNPKGTTTRAQAATVLQRMEPLFLGGI